MDFSNPDCDLVKKQHPKMCLSALLTMSVLSAHAHGAWPGLPASLAVPARAVWKAVATETLLHSAQVMFAPAWGTLWRLVADLEDILSWLQVGINKRNCLKGGKSLVWCDQSTAGLLDLGLSLCWFIPVGQHSLQWLWLQQDNHVRVLHLCSDLALVLQAYYPFPQASLPGGALYSQG